MEFPVPGGKLDVAITGGAVRTDIEIQRSHITAPVAKGRTTRYARAGFLPVWFNDTGGRQLPWLREVPAMGCNAMEWITLPKRRSVTATGLTEVESAKCVMGSFDRCPEGKRTPCGSFHPTLRAWAGLTLDDAAALIPAGEIVPLRDRRGIVYMVSPASLALYRDLSGGVGEWSPRQKLSIRIPDQSLPQSTECRNPHHETHTESLNLASQRACGLCGIDPVGPDGVLCPTCRTRLEARVRRPSGPC